MRRLFAAVLGLTLLIVSGGIVVGRTSTTGDAKQAPRIPFTRSTSLNWSGYVASGTTFNGVSGSWIQPTANCKKGQQYSAFWVGLDGNSSGTVEQIGTDADCFNGSPSYYAWYEMYPAASVRISNFTVVPGTTYTASVGYDAGSNTFTLTISGGGSLFSVPLPGSGQARSSAEWVAEAPSIGGHILGLTNFGTVLFTGPNASSPPTTSWEKMTMTDRKGRPKAVPSDLAANNYFSVTWEQQ